LFVFASQKQQFVTMTLRAAFSASTLCRFALTSHRFAAAHCVDCPMLSLRRSLTVSAASRRRAATSDKVINEVTKTRTIRWLPRNKKRVMPVVSEQHNDPSFSVLVDMLPSRDSDSAELYNESLSTARAEVDEQLKQLEEMANIQIPDIHLAMELEDENTDTEKTEV